MIRIYVMSKGSDLFIDCVQIDDWYEFASNFYQSNKEQNDMTLLFDQDNMKLIKQFENILKNEMVK